MRRFLPYLAGVGMSCIFGFSFMFTRGALDHIAPFHLLGLRFAAAAAAMLVLRALGLVRIHMGAADFRRLLPLALFQPVIYFTAETTGILLTSASYAGMMVAAIPIFVTIFAAIALREHPSWLQLPFIFLSVAGVIFIMTMDSASDVGASPLGTLALLAAVMAAASCKVAARRASKTYVPLQITWVMMVTGAVVFNSVALIQHLVAGNLNAYFAPLVKVWPAVLYLGVLSSVTAFFLVNFMLSKLAAVQSSIFQNAVTVIAISAGVVFRSEPFYWHHAAGTAAILIGIWGTNRFAPVLPERRGVLPEEQAGSVGGTNHTVG